MPAAPAAPPLPTDEAHRLAALRRLRLLDTPPQVAFDRLTRLAARVAGVPMAAIALLDRDRNWFKSSIGLPMNEVPREQAICAVTVAEGGPVTVLDLRGDPRFDRLSAGCGSGARFYAGVPLRSPDGACVGSLCVIDTQPRAAFARADRANLRDIGRLVEDEIARHAASELPTAADSREVDWDGWP
jgi:GAF domain-containing protein